MSDSVLVTNNVQSSVTTEQVESVTVEQSNTETIVSNNTSSTVSNTEVYNVLVEADSANVVVAGQPGPMGPTGLSEDSMAYARQTDFVTDELIYKGEADAGTALSAPFWRIRKIVIAADGDVSETWADGNTNFDNIWDNRISLTYL